MPFELRNHIEKIIQLTDAEFNVVQSHFKVQNFKKNEVIFQRDERVEYIYLVKSGLLKLVFTDRFNQQHILSLASEQFWETDFEAFLNQTLSTMSLHCLEQTSVFCLSFEKFQNLCLKINKMEKFFLKRFNIGHISAQKRILSLLSTNAKERYEQLLQQNPKLIQRVSKTTLASYLGVSRETLSRLN